MTKFMIPLALALTGCHTPLVEQQSLAARVHKATIDCTLVPATEASKPKKAKVCSQALLCQQTAKCAADALQAANVARSAGDVDVAAEAKAAGLDALADAACKRGGW